MAQKALITMAFAATVICFVSFGTYSVKSFVWKTTGKEATFFGAGMFYGSPAQTTEKYSLSIYPAPWAISTIWPVVLFTSLAAQAYLFYRSLSKASVLHLPPKTFYLWSGAWTLTTVWTFFFDGESHVGALVTVFFVLIFSIKTVATSCKYFHLYELRLAEETKTKNAMDHPFRYLVVDSLAIMSMWSTVAFGISIGYALAYKNSLHKTEAVLTGLMTSEVSATVGAIFVLFCFVTWWILDVAFWRNYTNCIKSIYPTFALTMLSLGLSNYNFDKGMTLNNLLCFGSSVLSLISMITRYHTKEFFNKLRLQTELHKD